jgi:putative intracellular protease/amidase
LLEDKLKEKGAIYKKGADWHALATSDGLLFTGQNPASAELVAENLYNALSK